MTIIYCFNCYLLSMSILVVSKYPVINGSTIVEVLKLTELNCELGVQSKDELHNMFLVMCTQTHFSCRLHSSTPSLQPCEPMFGLVCLIDVLPKMTYSILFYFRSFFFWYFIASCQLYFATKCRSTWFIHCFLQEFTFPLCLLALRKLEFQSWYSFYRGLKLLPFVRT